MLRDTSRPEIELGSWELNPTLPPPPKVVTLYLSHEMRNILRRA